MLHGNSLSFEEAYGCDLAFGSFCAECRSGASMFHIRAVVGEPGTVALLTTPDGIDGDRALNPGNASPEWQQTVAAPGTEGATL